MGGMSEEKGAARPRQVTMAAAVGVISSVLLVVGLFDTLDRLRTPAMRDVVDEFLAEAPGSSLGLETAQVIDAMRVLAFVTGALAAMMLVFAIFVLQRHRGARIGFTVVAALLLLSVPVAGLMPFFLAVAAFLLWSQPARDWYAGRPPASATAGDSRRMTAFNEGRPASLQQDRPVPGPQPDPQPPTPVPALDPASDHPPSDQSDRTPAPYPGFAQPPSQQQPAQPNQQPGYPAGYDFGHPPAQATSHRDPEKRPVTVTVAAALTWIGAGLTALLMVVFMAVLAGGGDAFIEEFERAARESDVTLTADEVLAIGWAISATFLVWSLISMALAVFAFRRSNAARIALVVSAVVAALFSLVAIMSVVSVVSLLLAGATVVLLFTGGANQWYSRRSSGAGHGGTPPGHAYAGQPEAGYPQQQHQDQQQPQYPPQPPQYPQQPPTGRNKPW